jgi:hypothetical protein
MVSFMRMAVKPALRQSDQQRKQGDQHEVDQRFWDGSDEFHLIYDF